ncbi:DNA-binding protein [Paenibacillus sp. CFBP13512]|uniref:helix-turn-helix domain-containing protein n=1 Tax=Paenibacillus sp. CFBP13512 TaxID=2184007 RepID=UPI0010C05178|nr:helix-turn-helix domain-containing protein [Paenibacillus sp. CFBP13512]TKJ86078.1 DNA-binding protein [Paenibacillus sp. CFBP13512]
MEKNYDLLTIDEARDLLRIGRNGMYDLIKNGMPHIKIGKQIRISRALLDTWIEEHIIAS